MPKVTQVHLPLVDEGLPRWEYDFKKNLIQGKWRRVVAQSDSRLNLVLNVTQATLTKAGLISVLQGSGLFDADGMPTDLGKKQFGPTIEHHLKSIRMFNYAKDFAESGVFGSRKAMITYRSRMLLDRWHQEPVTLHWLEACIDYQMEPLPISIPAGWSG